LAAEPGDGIPAAAAAQDFNPFQVPQTNELKTLIQYIDQKPTSSNRVKQ
jgi:hypothetical protein